MTVTGSISTWIIAAGAWPARVASESMPDVPDEPFEDSRIRTQSEMSRPRREE
ncbi:Uncharacterised protein [Bordetella pertussis]|nr:Uncharacterised protein [Bordetella pertussis]